MNTDTRTDEELEAIIAQWCGWLPSLGDHACRNAWLDLTGEDWPLMPPRYCRSLDAVNGAEIAWCSQAGPEDASHPRFLLSHALYKVTVPINRQPVFANARERAEALVRVIEESKQ